MRSLPSFELRDKWGTNNSNCNWKPRNSKHAARIEGLYLKRLASIDVDLHKSYTIVVTSLKKANVSGRHSIYFWTENLTIRK